MSLILKIFYRFRLQGAASKTEDKPAPLFNPVPTIWREAHK